MISVNSEEINLSSVLLREKTSVTVSREEIADIVDSLDGMSLQCQRLLYRLQKISARLGDEDKPKE